MAHPHPLSLSGHGVGALFFGCGPGMKNLIRIRQVSHDVACAVPMISFHEFACVGSHDLKKAELRVTTFDHPLLPA